MRIRTLAIIGIICAMFLLPLPGLVATNTRATRAQSYTWEDVRIWGQYGRMKDCLVHDVDPRFDGPEVLVAGESEKVSVITGQGVSYTGEDVFDDTWFIESFAVGDIHPDYAGDEIITVGRSEVVNMVWRDADGWKNQKVFQEAHWIYDVAIADVYPGNTGPEMYIVTDEMYLFMAYWDPDGKGKGTAGYTGDPDGTIVEDGWYVEPIFKDTEYLNKVAIGDFDSLRDGIEITVSGGTNTLWEVYYENGTWHNEALVKRAIQDLDVGDFDYNWATGDKIVYTSGNNAYFLIQNYSINATHPPWEENTAFTDAKTINCITVGDAVGGDGLGEIIVGTNTYQVYVLQYSWTRDAWNLFNAFSGDFQIKEVAVGDADRGHDGNEIVAVDSGGNTFKIQFETEDFSIVPVQAELSLGTTDSIGGSMVLDTLGGFDDDVELVVETSDLANVEAHGLDVTIAKATAHPKELVDITFETSNADPGSYTIRIKATSVKSYDQDTITAPLEHTATFTITVTSTDEFSYDLNVLTQDLVCSADFSAEGLIQALFVNPSKAVNPSLLTIGTRGEPEGVTVTLTPKSVPVGTTADINITITTTANTPPGEYTIILWGDLIVGDSTNRTHITRSVPLNLEVQPPGDPDFGLEVVARDEVLRQGQKANITVVVTSIYSFTDAVDLTVSIDKVGVTGLLGKSSIVPTANVTLTLSATETASLGTFRVTIQGIGRGITKEAFLDLELYPPPPKFEFTVEASRYEFKYKWTDTEPIEDISIWINFTAEEGYKGDVLVSWGAVPSGSNLGPADYMLVDNKPASYMTIIDANGSAVYTYNIDRVELGQVHYYNLTFYVDDGVQNESAGISIKVVAEQDQTEGNWMNTFVEDYGMFLIIVVLVLVLAGAAGAYLFVKLRSKPADQEDEEDESEDEARERLYGEDSEYSREETEDEPNEEVEEPEGLDDEEEEEVDPDEDDEEPSEQSEDDLEDEEAESSDEEEEEPPKKKRSSRSKKKSSK